MLVWCSWELPSINSIWFSSSVCFVYSDSVQPLFCCRVAMRTWCPPSACGTNCQFGCALKVHLTAPFHTQFLYRREKRSVGWQKPESRLCRSLGYVLAPVTPQAITIAKTMTLHYGTSSVPMSNSPPMSLTRHCHCLPYSLTKAGCFQGFVGTKFVFQGVHDNIIYGPSSGG